MCAERMGPEHPRLHVTARSYPGLLSLDELRRSVTEGPGRELWRTLQSEVERRAVLPPYDPSTPLPGRQAGAVERRENDYPLSEAALQRVTDAALAYLIAERPEYRDDALRQLEWMFDPDPWPEWRHPVNAERGVFADHRIGSHLRQLSIAYDWLYPALRPDQRGWLLAGIRGRALAPVLESRTRDAHWGNYNNWTGVIAAGMGTAGLALEGEIDEAGELIEAAIAYQRTYLATLGPDGEFNESPAYAASVLTAIRFFESLRYHRGRDAAGGEAGLDPELRERVGRFGRWYACHVILPRGIVPFGDCSPDARPNAVQIGVIAELCDDPVLRWFYRRVQPVNGYPNLALELLTLAGSGEVREPDGQWPLAMAYDAYGKSVISRSDWDPAGAACLVSAKAAHGWEAMRARGDTSSYHMDYDAGQVCIASGSEHLIVDLGSSGGYSRGERGRYYGKGTAGHNVLMLDGATTRELGDPMPGMTAAECDEARGAWFRFDLTGIYEGAASVARTLVHLLPGTVVVLDEAVLGEERDVSLRWHTAHPCSPEPDGSFVVMGRKATAVCRMVSLAGEAAVAAARHRYHPPYDRDYYGTKFEDGHPYVEASLHADRVVLLTLFSVVAGRPGDTLRWRQEAEGWSIGAGPDRVSVVIGQETLDVTGGAGARWRVPRTARAS